MTTPQYPDEKPRPDKPGMWWDLEKHPLSPEVVTWHGAPYDEPYLAHYTRWWVECHEGRWLQCPSTMEFDQKLAEITAAIFNPLTKLNEDELGAVAGCLMIAALDRPERRDLHTLALRITEHIALVRAAQPKTDPEP